MNKKIKAKLTVSRRSDGVISISIVDEKSRIEFFDATMTPEDFANAITGYSRQPMEAEVRGLEYVGKNVVRERRSVFCPLKTYSREVLSAWLRENAKEDGWIVDYYLGSQGSVVYNQSGEGCALCYSVLKYIDDDSAEEGK